MADDGRFFGATDPEWAISQLRAQAAAASQERARRWRPLQVVGVVLTTGLVAGAFLLGLTPDVGTPVTPSAPRPAPKAAVLPSAPQVTMAPVPPPPRPKPKPTPTQTPTPTPTPTPTMHVAPKPDRPSKQVGPNKPIKTPIDPDDR